MIYGNSPKCWYDKKTSLTDHFSRYIKFENVIRLEILSGTLLLHMTYSLTWLKSAKLYGKRKMFSIFCKQCCTLSTAKLSILNQFLFWKQLCNSYFIGSKSRRLIFEYWLAPTGFILDLKLEKHDFLGFCPKHNLLLGGKGWRIFFSFNFVVPKVIISVSFQ